MQNDELMEDGENQAVRMFLMMYGAQTCTVEGMRSHMEDTGFDGYWPEWVNVERGHLTKGGAQSWLRHLFSLED